MRAGGFFLLVADLHARVVTDDSELLRHLTIDPDRDYQPVGSIP